MSSPEFNAVLANPDKAVNRIEALEEALLTSTTMLEALLVQLNSWGHASAVNARGQIWKNNELLGESND
jgi:hypothetical protein